MRPRVLRRRLALAWFGAVLAGVAMVTAAPHARAAGDIPAADGQMSVTQFVGYVSAELLLVGAVIFLVLIGVFRAIDWWADR